MNCSKCQTACDSAQKFCGECGEKLGKECSKCNSYNPPQYKFCGECGQKLAPQLDEQPEVIDFDERLSKIQKYLPEGLTEKILSQRDRIEGEHKQVTVMFCDVEGYTGLSERIGAEEAYKIMGKVYEIMIYKVHDYGGTVNEMTGDGVIALFGAPIALEDAPVRAIRSAYSIHREMVKYSNKIMKLKKGISSLKVRIGVNTGPVVVGTLGNDLRVEFKAVGDTVNLASRMENLAEPGTTCVTEETFKQTEGLFRFESLGEKKVKGRQEPVKTYRVIAPSSRRTRFDVSAERGLTRFIGRERELELLLDGFERSKIGRGQAFSIVAEAGLGKSRLLYEFRKAISSENLTFLEGRCLSYSRTVSYHPLIDILKSNFDIEESDSDIKIKEKVKKGLKILGADDGSTLPYLLELLAVKDSGIDKIPMSQEARKAHIVEALNRIVLKGSEIRPLVMAFEDLHWIDKSSEDLVKNLLENISGARVLLVLTYRPEFVYAWGGKSYHNQLNLNRLSNRESLIMVSHLLNAEELDPALEKLILEKTEGVPFFIEEFIRSLKDLKVLKEKDNKYYLAKDLRDVTIPSTIQDVIMARVDSLPEPAKALLCTGSVMEPDFSHELIEQVSNISEKELLAHLSALKDSELIYERGIYPQSTYFFKHTLTREVVYNSLLTERKRKLHERIGQTIEKLSTDFIDEQCGILTEHFIRSGNYKKGAKYSKLAGKRAARSGSNIDAIEYAKKRVYCLEKMVQTDTIQKKLIDARTILASYYLTSSRIVKAKEAITPIANLALDLNYEKRLPGVHIAIGLYSLWIEEDYQKGLRHIDEVIWLSQKTDNMKSFYIPLWTSCFYLAAHLSLNCEFEKSFKYIKKSFNLSTAANDHIGIAFALGLKSLSYIYQGKIGDAYQKSEETLQKAKNFGTMHVKGMAFIVYGQSCYYKGVKDCAEKNLIKGIDYCEKTGHIVYGPIGAMSLGDNYFDLANLKKSVEYYHKGLSILQPAKMLPSLMKLFQVALVRTRVMEGNYDVNLKELFQEYHHNKFKAFQVKMARYIGEILLNIGNEHISDAEDWINKTIKMAKETGMLWYLGKGYALYAEFYKRKNNRPKAKENLGKAVETLLKCGADGWVQKFDKELAEIS